MAARHTAGDQISSWWLRKPLGPGSTLKFGRRTVPGAITTFALLPTSDRFAQTSDRTAARVANLDVLDRALFAAVFPEGIRSLDDLGVSVESLRHWVRQQDVDEGRRGPSHRRVFLATLPRAGKRSMP